MVGPDNGRSFTGGMKMVGPDNGRTVMTGKDVSTADIAWELELPEDCDEKDPFCVLVESKILPEGHEFTAGLDINVDEIGLGFKVSVTTESLPDPTVKEITGNAYGEVTPVGIKSDIITCGVTLAMTGSVNMTHNGFTNNDEHLWKKLYSRSGFGML